MAKINDSYYSPEFPWAEVRISCIARQETDFLSKEGKVLLSKFTDRQYDWMRSLRLSDFCFASEGRWAGCWIGIISCEVDSQKISPQIFMSSMRDFFAEKGLKETVYLHALVWRVVFPEDGFQLP
jgi:hypothetical protein